MKVSIVIPVYNVIEYIEECIESVINQSYKNIEIILVNDGSTDGSEEVCHRYVSDDRVVYINQVNQGLSAARNAGIKKSTGEFLIFLDSDDYLNKGVISDMVEEMTDSSVDILVTGYTIKMSDRFIDSYSPAESISSGVDAMKELLKCKVPHVAWGKMYRKSVYQGYNFPIGKMCEDLCEVALSFGRANLVKFVPFSSLIYRRRVGSIMHSYKKQLFVDSYHVYGLLESRLYATYDRLEYSEFLDTKYLKIMISNVNLALRAKDIDSALLISDLLREKANKRSTMFLSTPYTLAFYMIKYCRPLYFFANELLINKLKYKLLKVS